MKVKKLLAVLLSGAMIAGTVTAPADSILQKAIGSVSITAQAAAAMRRPCDPQHPMLIVHIDTWNYADPAKIIETIPESIRPYCVFNISLSINWSNTEHKWLMVQDGYECAKSWLKTCSDMGVWCMVQPASGGQCHFPDYDNNYNIVNSPNKSRYVQHAYEDYENTIYAEFFRDYPSFIGFNYSEQFWGFASQDHPCTFQQRYQHFAHLLKLCNKYGGYLNINFCANRWSAGLNPIAMLKTNTQWREACEKYGQNLMLEEKYTQESMIEDVESQILGLYLSGYCGCYGVRYDDTGWTDLSADGTSLSTKDQYRQITGLPIHAERMIMNGATVIDGPELVWNDDFGESWGGVKDSEGYSCRNWFTKDQYVNSTLNFFEKMVDGTYRIPSRQEVIDRTKYIIIQDVSSGGDNTKYSTYQTLFEGLYRMPNDGNLWDNKNLYKSTGRYPTIPTTYGLRDDTARSFKYQLKQSQLGSRWSSISAKQNEFNREFASEYVGTCYAGHYNNTWVTYNNDKLNRNQGVLINLQYNTCSTFDANFNAYGNAIINEYSDHIDVYANNFDNKAQSTLVTDTFKVNGCNSRPTYTAHDTGRNQTSSQITESYSDGTYTLVVKHNGPIDIRINCTGSNTGRKTNFNKANVQPITPPAFYTGTRQYEGEFLDVKNVEGYVQNACNSGVTGIQGQGFLKYGKNANAAVKDTVHTNKAGEFTLKLRYSSESNIDQVDLYVNGTKQETMSLSNTYGYSNWKTYEKKINLKAGDNKIEFKANSALPSSLYIDNFTVDGDFGDGSGTIIVNEPDPIQGRIIKDLKVADYENAGDWSIVYDTTTGSMFYGDRDITVKSIPSYLKNTETIRTACDSKLFEGDEATFTVNQDATVFVAVDDRVNQGLNWLKSWTKTSDTMSTSNDVTLTVYRRDFSANSGVTLGTNGAQGLSANYIAFVLPKQTQPSETYPKNIRVETNSSTHQIRILWDNVSGADRYGIAVYRTGKWRIQTSNLTTNVYTSPKHLTPGKTYKVAVAARVNGVWDTSNAIKNAVTVTVK